MTYSLLCIGFSLVQLLAAYGLGRWTMFRFFVPARRDPSPDGGARLLLAEMMGLGLGLLFLALLLSVLGFAQWLRPLFISIVFAAGFAAFGGSLVFAPIALPRMEWHEARWYAVLFAIPIVVIFLESLVPDASGDAYLYHLSVPLYYVLEGGFAPQDYELTYHYPLLMEMLYTPALAFGYEQAAVLLNFWIFMAAACALAALARLMIGKAAAFACFAAMLWSPSFLLWTPTTHTETGGTFFLILAVAASCGLPFQFDRRSYVLAGLFTGALVGCKLLYAVIAVAITASIFARVLQKSARDRFVGPALFIVACAVAYFIWPVKNWLYAGNPVYPLFADRFDSPAVLISEAARVGELHGFPALEGPLDWLQNALKGFWMLIVTGDILFLLSVALVPIVWVITIRGRPWWLQLTFHRPSQLYLWTLLFVLVLIVAHYGSILQTRWFIPVYAVCILAFGWVWEWQNEAGRWYHTMLFVPILAIVFACFVLAYRERVTIYTPHHALWTGLSAGKRAEYLKDTPHFDWAQAVNEAVPPDGRVLVIQGPPYAQVRWYRRRFIQNGQQWLVLQTETGRSPDEMAADLQIMNVTHVVAPNALADETWIELRGRWLEESLRQKSQTIYKLRLEPSSPVSLLQ